ncbi:MAG: NAD(P)H-hydrate dehydratase [Desulfobulbus sp.]|jgi:hydroxyethylthiazole kinase-like uncharacterized protein yjeF
MTHTISDQHSTQTGGYTAILPARPAAPIGDIAPTPLALAAEMRELDRYTIEEIGVPGMVLMENAGRATVDRMEAVFGPVSGKTLCILVGPGNNGGDGLVIARTAHGRGGFPVVLFLTPPDRLQGDAGRNAQLLQRLELPFEVVDRQATAAAIGERIRALHARRPLHSLVDALFGIGLTRPLEGVFREAVEAINLSAKETGVPVIGVDIPSGLDSDTGAVRGVAVRADLTVTYGLAKAGQVHHGGPWTGRLERVDIGIPPMVVQQMAGQGMLLDATWGRRLRQREQTAHKGTSGHLLILAGSTGKTGASLLCGQGALRSGAGLVTHVVPQDLNPVFEVATTESMSIPLPHSHGFLSARDLPLIEQSAQGKNALVLGPGIGLAPETGELVLHLYATCPIPLVLDADALTLLAAHPEALRTPAGPRIFTPHPGEMARLLGTDTGQVQADRLRAAQWLNDTAKSAREPLITVLKGAGTVVAAATGPWAINTTGNPGMATGGMGDVLSGIIGSLLAQGHAPMEAACLGVYLHGLAADNLARRMPYGYTAGEVARILPRVMGSFLSADTEAPC